MKRTIYLSALALIVSITFISCYDYKYVTYSLEDEINNEWRNATKQHIIDVQGAPDRIVPIDADKCILVYEEYRTSAIAVSGYGFSKQRRVYAEFYIGVDSRCYQVKSNYIKVAKQTVNELTGKVVKTEEL